MPFEQLLYQLNTTNWHHVVYRIHDILKPELQTQKGFIRLVKKQNEQNRKDDIDRILNQFQNTGIEGLDERINTCVKEILNINNYYKTSLQYELIETMLHLEGINTYPNLLIAKDFLKDTSITSQGYNRLCAVLYQICNQSLSQANKSNAGTAGEGIARAIFNAVGLESDIHFSEQHKSKKGSDTDFVLPWEKDCLTVPPPIVFFNSSLGEEKPNVCEALVVFSSSFFISGFLSTINLTFLINNFT